MEHPGEAGHQLSAAAGGTPPPPSLQQLQQQQNAGHVGDVGGLAALHAHHQQQMQQQVEAEAAQELIRRQQRAEAVRQVEEANAIRMEALGSDRYHNRYWRFASVGRCGDSGLGRIWEENGQDGSLQLLLTSQQVEDLKGALEPKGLREGALYNALVRVEGNCREAMPGEHITLPAGFEEVRDLASSSSHNHHQQEQAAADGGSSGRGSTPGPLGLLLRSAGGGAAGLERQLASGVLHASRVRDGGGGYIEDAGVGEEDVPGVAALKQQLLRIEAAVADDMVDDEFNRYEWMEAVRGAADLVSIRRCLGQLEGALVPEQLSKAWRSHPVLVKRAWVPVGNEIASAVAEAEELGQAGDGPRAAAAVAAAAAGGGAGEGKGGRKKQAVAAAAVAAGVAAGGGSPPEGVERLAWLPATLSALAWRVAALDAALCYGGEQPARDTVEGYK